MAVSHASMFASRRWTLLAFLAVVASAEHQASLKRLPEGLSQQELHAYWQGIAQLQAKETVQADNIATFPVEEVAEHMKLNPEGVAPELQGLWWWKDHPTMKAMVFTMYGGPADAPDAVYVSMVSPGGFAVPNMSKHVSDLSWFSSHGLEMSFPTFKGNMTPGTSNTYLTTRMTGMYKHFPMPAAMLEGWNLREAASWDPKKSEDVAQCFCSIYYTKENELQRHNFGHYAYTGLRLVDSTGARTKHWSEFKAAMAAAGIDSFATVKTSAPAPEMPMETSAAPAHPGSSEWLGKTVPETMVHSVDGKVMATATGQMACEYGGLSAPIFLRASWRGNVKLTTPRASGSTSLEVIWLGWNNLVKNEVDRYLIVKELDSEGSTLKQQCTTYPDVNPPGYKDPLPLMADRYKLVKSSASSNEYEYQWKLQSGAEMVSSMITDPKGFPFHSVAVTSTTKDNHRSVYNFSYQPPSDTVDSSVFYEYKNYDCAKVSNFTTPDICVDSWLALQYECAFTQAVDSEVTV